MGAIKVKPWGNGQGDHVLINEEDFNREFHVRLDEKAESEKPKRGTRAKSEPTEAE